MLADIGTLDGRGDDVVRCALILVGLPPLAATVVACARVAGALREREMVRIIDSLAAARRAGEYTDN